MTEPYTPTTETVRERTGDGRVPSIKRAWQAEFDRWIAHHDREVAAGAWLEGHAAGVDYQGDGWNSDSYDPNEDNPYRTT